MTSLRPASPSIRLGVSTALALLWIACSRDVVVDSGHGGGGTGGDACCTGTDPCPADCIPGDCAAGAFCDVCTYCRFGVSCATDANCPAGSTCDTSGLYSLCTTGASCTSNAGCPQNAACDTATHRCTLTSP